MRLSTICQRIFGYPMNRDNYSDVDDEGDGLQPVLCGIKRFSALAAEGLQMAEKTVPQRLKLRFTLDFDVRAKAHTLRSKLSS